MFCLCLSAGWGQECLWVWTSPYFAQGAILASISPVFSQSNKYIALDCACHRSAMMYTIYYNSYCNNTVWDFMCHKKTLEHVLYDDYFHKTARKNIWYKLDNIQTSVNWSYQTLLSIFLIKYNFVIHYLFPNSPCCLAELPSCLYCKTGLLYI